MKKKTATKQANVKTSETARRGTRRITPACAIERPDILEHPLARPHWINHVYRDRRGKTVALAWHVFAVSPEHAAQVLAEMRNARAGDRFEVVPIGDGPCVALLIGPGFTREEEASSAEGGGYAYRVQPGGGLESVGHDWTDHVPDAVARRMAANRLESVAESRQGAPR